ncbi:MAG: hypothetical protein WCG27_12120 [Pseudomonadota bacterium]
MKKILIALLALTLMSSVAFANEKKASHKKGVKTEKLCKKSDKKCTKKAEKAEAAAATEKTTTEAPAAEAPAAK